MNQYDLYAQLLGVPYDDGDHDCYGLFRRYCMTVYDLELPNYARSADFFSSDLNLLMPSIEETEFTLVNAAHDRLEQGDLLLMSVPSPNWPKGEVNHIAVFVGNGTFLHHMYGKESREDYLTDKWKNRIMAVFRHPICTEVNKSRSIGRKTEFLEMVVNHARQRYGVKVIETLDSPSGASGDGS